MAAPTLHLSNASAAGTAAPLHVTLMGPGVFATLPLPASGTVMIGRDESTDLRIVDPSASRLHARLHVDGGLLFVEDLATSNGTFLRDSKLAPNKRVALQIGEAVTIGQTTLMVQKRRPTVPPRRFRTHGAFEELLEDACDRAAPASARFALLRLLVDGDVAPSRAADLIQPALRTGDFLGQYATGDYEVLLLDTSPERAGAIAEDLLRRFSAESLASRVAVAQFPTDGRTAEALIGHASAQLRGPETAGARTPILKSEWMRKLYHLAGRAASGQTANGLINVLILGETGVGKDVLAQWIHLSSPRAKGPYVCINCAALTETLLESELFGHDKGAFTGATVAKAGLLEAAAGGTVFLDEVGDMPERLQQKLLRTIENREITRVGEVRTRPIDVRFVSATNHDLETEVAAREFRSDLYFRLNGISLTLPPLRERPEEIEPLARQFIAAATARAPRGRRAPQLSAEALEIMRAYSWPGNIRELRNLVERALVLCESGEITPEHLPLEKMRVAPAAGAAAGDEDLPPAGLTPQELADRQRIIDALAAHAGSQSRAAKKLGLARGTLIARLKKYGIRRPRV